MKKLPYLLAALALFKGNLLADGLVGETLSVVEPDNFYEDSNTFDNSGSSALIGGYNYLTSSWQSVLIGDSNQTFSSINSLGVGIGNTVAGNAVAVFGTGNEFSNSRIR